MRVLPIRYSADVEALTRFYRALGLESGPASRPGGWIELPADGGTLALHRAAAEDAGRCELAFEADEPLEDVADRLRAAGFEPGPVTDEGFGFSLRVRDPDGVWVQINRYDRELYT
ncbi:VOC family protein [Amycolatopsis sp. WQ 127309]|uniref:VOC family protein n=1 Tax=Amycolatopsis sp. WQ 127309 TaxID=2932773 RepID=UPI001FF6F2C4|nr:VOC family protein [Amycolatopsis sp. WQ 127309]UOZ11888.1 VOC family protein [Amycolatopsis sp. WQ 127309]